MCKECEPTQKEEPKIEEAVWGLKDKNPEQEMSDKTAMRITFYYKYRRLSFYFNLEDQNE